MRTPDSGKLKPETEVAEVWKEDSSPSLNFTLHVNNLLEKSWCIHQFDKIQEPSHPLGDQNKYHR